MVEKRILIAEEVAELLKIDKQRVYELCRAKKLPFILIGERQYRFDLLAIENWINSGGNSTNSSEEKEI